LNLFFGWNAVEADCCE